MALGDWYIKHVMAENELAGSPGSKPGSPVISRDDEDESFLLKDKVISVVNLLTKYKIKLWELPMLDSSSNAAKLVEVGAALGQLGPKFWSANEPLDDCD